MSRQKGLAAGLLVAGLFTIAGLAQAQMYKWVGPDGKITYSDVPPPTSAKQVERKEIPVGDANASDLPADLAAAVRGNPVTLFTAPKCVPCQQGRSLLVNRGVPFSEKTVVSNEDIDRLRQVSGDAQLPFLQVGGVKQQGYSQEGWTSALTTAGYPEASKLPKTYRQPPAVAAAPPPQAAPAQPSGSQQTTRAAESLPAPAGNAPPGFRF
jgi:glutaredoxin